jgi:hypothetical protein
VEPITTLIVTAAALGAAMVLKPTAEQAIKDAYVGFKRIIADHYGDYHNLVDSLDFLAKKPADANRQAAFGDELTAAGAAENHALVEAARAIHAAIEAHSPDAYAALGLDIGKIKAKILEGGFHPASVNSSSLPIEGSATAKAESAQFPTLASMSKHPSKIFISYKRNMDPDEGLALLLKGFLSQAGHIVHIDQLSITVGLEWAKEIKRLIAESDFVIVLLSSASVNSEMVAEEIKLAHDNNQKTGRSRLLPVRVNFTETLPYQLSHYLDRLQYTEWHHDDDTPRLAQRLFDAVEHFEIWGPTTVESTPVTSPMSLEEEGDLPLPKPYADPRFIEALEAPGGTVRLRSRFYIERLADAHLYQEIIMPVGTTTTIRAARQAGKSSLLIRAVARARQAGYKIAHLDLQPLESSILQSPDTFLRYLAEVVVGKLGLDVGEVEKSWRGSLPPSHKITNLFEGYVLPTIDTSVVLAMDEVERLLQTPFHDNFFSLVRSWHNKRAENELWEKLNIVQVISTEPNLLIKDVHCSPFNVGLRLELDDFNELQVRTLNERYHAPVAEHDLADCMDLFGGHPYLTQKALYTLVKDGLTWADLVEQSSLEAGPFGDHLRHYLWILYDQPDLASAMKHIIQHGKCPKQVLFYRLLRAGLVKGQWECCVCRCRLYKEYLRSRL